MTLPIHFHPGAHHAPRDEADPSKGASFSLPRHGAPDREGTDHAIHADLPRGGADAPGRADPARADPPALTAMMSRDGFVISAEPPVLAAMTSRDGVVIPLAPALHVQQAGGPPRGEDRPSAPPRQEAPRSGVQEAPRSGLAAEAGPPPFRLAPSPPATPREPGVAFEAAAPGPSADGPAPGELAATQADGGTEPGTASEVPPPASSPAGEAPRPATGEPDDTATQARADHGRSRIVEEGVPPTPPVVAPPPPRGGGGMSASRDGKRAPHAPPPPEGDGAHASPRVTTLLAQPDARRRRTRRRSWSILWLFGWTRRSRPDDADG